MTPRAVKIATLPLTVAFFVIGWIVYNPVLRIVSSGIKAPIATPNPTGAFSHHLTMALTIASLGLMIGLATLISGRFSSRRQYGSRFASLLLGGLVVAVGMTYYLSHEFSLVGKYLSDTQSDADTPEIPWLISAFPLHQIGLYAGAAVLIAGVVFCIRTSNGENQQSEQGVPPNGL